MASAETKEATVPTADVKPGAIVDTNPANKGVLPSASDQTNRSVSVAPAEAKATVTMSVDIKPGAIVDTKPVTPMAKNIDVKVDVGPIPSPTAEAKSSPVPTSSNK